MEIQALSLHELNGLVKRSIRSCMPDTYWLHLLKSFVADIYSALFYYLVIEFIVCVGTSFNIRIG